MEMYLSDEGMQHVEHFLYRRLRVKAGSGVLELVMHENLHALCEHERLLLTLSSCMSTECCSKAWLCLLQQ